MCIRDRYAKEQDALEIEIAELEKAVTGYEQSQKSAEKFIALIDKYENFDTLTNTMLNEFVDVYKRQHVTCGDQKSFHNFRSDPVLRSLGSICHFS